MTEAFKLFFISSLSGTLLAVVLTLLRPITKRFFSSAWHYYMWLVVLLVMILPVKIIPPDNQETMQITEPASVSEFHAPTNNTAVVFSDNTEQAHYIPAEKEASSNTSSLIKLFNSFSVLFSRIWLGFAVLLFALKLFRYAVFIMKIRTNTEVVSCPELNAYTNRKVIARVSDTISSPLIAGLFRPVLLLPKTPLTDEKLHNVLSHEMMHLKRNDLLYKWFVSFVKCVCWYNPAIYLIYRQISIDCEISCDLAVVDKMSDDEKIGYIETILSLLTYSNSVSVPLTTGMTGSKKILKRRFNMIKRQFKVSKKLMIVSAILAAVIFGIAIFAGGVLNGRLSYTYKNTILELNTDERTGDTFNTLLLGVDEQNRADTIMLLMISEDSASGISIPRNTMFNNRSISDILMQKNGDQKVIDTIRKKLSVPVTYYARVKIDIIKDLIDNNGGKMTIDVPMDMKYDDPYINLHIDLKKGEKQSLSSESICELLRFRRSNNGIGYTDGDLGRIKIGQQVAANFLSENSTSDIIRNSKKLVDSISRNVVTNYSLKNYSHDKDIFKNKEIAFYTAPGKNIIMNGMYIYEIDYEGLDKLIN